MLMTLQRYDALQQALIWAEAVASDRAPRVATASDQGEQALATENTTELRVLPPVTFGPGFARLTDLPPTQGLETRFGGRLIKRENTLLVGDGGVGKGLLGVWLAAKITTGEPLPDETVTHPPMHVAVVTLEDSIAVWRERFVAAGGDESGLIIFRVEDQAFEINELHTLGQTYGLVVIDPALLLCGAEGISPNDNRRVREMLQKLQKVAQRLDCPILIIHHPNSRGNILGGPTWRNAVRSVLELGVQADKSLGLAHTKHNNVEKQATLWFQIAVKNNTAAIDYIGANENLKPYVKPRPKAGDDDGSGKIVEQIAWLIETLAANQGDLARNRLRDLWIETTRLSDRTLTTVIKLAEEMNKVVRVRVTSKGTHVNEHRVVLKAVYEQDQVIDAMMDAVDQELKDLTGEQ